MSAGVIIRPVIEEATKTITIDVPPTWKLIVRTVADPATQSGGENISQQPSSGKHIPPGDRNAPYPTPAVLEALGFSSAQKYRDAHLDREYPQQQITEPSDDESEDTPYQVDLANKIRKLASERTPGWY
jgi:hypothetical protein